jgi:hypothetical protein
MMMRVVLLSLVIGLGLPAAGRAQAKPDLSGTWTLSTTNPPNYPGSAGWGIPSPTVVVKQSASDISIQSGQYGVQPMTVVYKLDGSDTIWDAPSTTQSGSTAVVKWRTKARWDGNKLLLFTWNTALNQMRDIVSVSNGTMTVVRGTEQPGPSTNATLTYTKAR